MGSGVGTPVTGRPRHRPGRAVFPHPVPRSYSLPRGPSQLPVTWPSCYYPHVCSLVFIQPYNVRHEYPLRATYSRGVLRHVAGFPDLRLLCPIRHPSTLVLANLPDRSLFLDSTRAHAVSRVHHPSRVPTLTVSSRHFVAGAVGASWVPRRISSCMPRPDDSAGPPHPRPLS